MKFDAHALGIDAAGADLWSRVDGFIAATPLRGPFDVAKRDALILELAAWQRTHCLALDRALRAMGAPAVARSLDDVAGVPTDAFKTARLATFASDHTVRVFRTSGTTRDTRGEHAFATLALYQRAALAAADRWLLPHGPYRFVLLAERESDAPHSSLSYMLARFAERTGDSHGTDPWMIDRGQLDVNRLRAALDAARENGEPVALLGATFAFVHAIDALDASMCESLPPGSVVMPTGGFKGRSRELEPTALFALLGERFGVRRDQIVQEYGMTELSSQAYEAHADGVAAGRYVSPPWMVVTAMDPVTLAPLPHGEPGVLRVIDLANVGSSVALQTADLGVTDPDGFEVRGRAPGATPRGCARAMDALLSGDA